MNKPFDLQNLEERLKSKGLHAVEGLAEVVSQTVLEWTQESCVIHPNVFVKSAGTAAVEILKPIIAGLVDKIDGQEG